MEYNRLVGIDFGTSTSVIRTKIYDSKGEPDGQRLAVQSVVFNNGSSMVPTIVRKKENSFMFGYDAEIPTKNSEVFRSFKIDLQSSDPEKRERAKRLTKKYFEYIYNEYYQQKINGYLGNTDAQDKTFVSYPVKWETETRDFMLEAARSAGFENVVGMDEAEAAIDAITVQCRDVLKKEGFLMEGTTANIMLIDMGAGTTDIVVSKYTPGADATNEILTTWPKDGNILFGGQEMDIVLKNYIVSKFPPEYRDQITNKITIDKIKAWKENIVSYALKQNETVSECGDAEMIASFFDIEIEDYSIDREEFESLFEDYITQFVGLVVGAIHDSGLSPDDIDLIVLTGGHSKWYFIEDILSGKTSKFGEVIFKKICENPKRIMSVALPQETVALGLVYSNISGEFKFDKAEHLWKTYLETKSISTLMEAVKSGHVVALNELGYIYLHGNGLPKNFEKAMEYFEKSANGGYALAFSNLGYCYLEKKENEKAIACFLKAAEQNLPIAYNNLGICYRDGLGVPKDTDKALELFKKSFDGGFMKAKTNYQKLFNAVYPGKKSEIENFSGDILEYCNQIVGFHHVNFSIGTSIPINKLNNFTITFPNFNAHKQKILCYWDDTVFGGGKDGFLLTDKCFYWHTFLGNPMYASVNDIASFQVGNANSVVITLKNGMSSIIPFNSKTLSNQLAAFLSKTVDYITSR